MTVLNQNPCYNKVSYKGTALYMQGSFFAILGRGLTDWEN